MNLANPQFLSLGCNTGTVNTFTPIDVTDLTSGVYSEQTLLEGNNLACFILQLGAMVLPTPIDKISSGPVIEKNDLSISPSNNP